eukprot:403368520
MGKLTYFLGGVAVGGVQVLNYIYENELLMQKIQREIATVQRMTEFSADKLLDFQKKGDYLSRDATANELQVGIHNMQYFYHYLQYSYINAVKERILNLTYPDRQSLSDQDKLDIEAYIEIREAEKARHKNRVAQ